MIEEKEIVEVDTTLEAVVELALLGVPFEPETIKRTESFNPNNGEYNTTLSFVFYIEPEGSQKPKS